MSDDLLITPGSRKMEFKDSSANIDAKIETDASGNLKITNAGGDIEIGDTSSDVFIGDGTNNIDIVFEQSGEIRGTSGVTLTLGASGSNVAMATDLSLGGNDLTNVGNLTMTGNLTVSGTTTTVSSTNTTIADSLIELNSGLTGANAKDIGFIFERGSTGNNAGFVWDESADRFTVFTTTDTAASDTVNTSAVANFQAGSFYGNGANLTSLNASNLGSGTVPSARLSLSASDIPSLAASKITSGTFADARIPSLAASKITSGTFADARIPSLAASKITSGTFDDARIAASSITQHTDSKYLRSNANDTTSGNITISKALPKLILDSPGSGDNFTSQGAQISLGESGDGGSAALHLTYRGDGYAYIGMGVLPSSGIPPFSQIRFTYNSNDIRFNSTPNVTGSTMWHAGNDGSGSGLDADTVDGIQGASFLRSDADDTATGNITITGSGNKALTVGNGSARREIKINSNTWPEVTFYNNSTENVRIGSAQTSGTYNTTEGDFYVYAPSTNTMNLIVPEDGGSLTRANGAHTIWDSGNDGASSGLDADKLDGQHGSHYLNYSNFTNTPTIPTNNNQLTNGAGYITGLAFNNLTSKTSGTGEYSTSGYLRAGRGSGGVALTHNDGYGNANVTFNHVQGIPEQATNCGRIVVNTDATTNATMYFELKTNTGTSAVNTPSAMELNETGAFFPQYLYHMADTDTYIRFTDNRVRIVAGNSTAFDSANTYLITTSGLNASNLTSGTVPDARIAASSITQHTDSKYLRSNAADTASGNLTFTGNIDQTAGSFISHGFQTSNLNTSAWQVAGTSKERGIAPFRYQNGATGQPESGNNANWGLNVYAHAGSGGNYPYGTQFAMGSSQNLFFRWFDNGTAQGWKEVVTADTNGDVGVDGRVTAEDLTLSSLSAQNSETTALMINGSNIVGIRNLGSNAFNSTTIPTNNNQLTNGAGYITSSNSAITNKLPLAGGTMTGELQVNARLDVGDGSSNDTEIRIQKADNNVSDHIQFYNGTTRVGEIGCEDNTWLRINQETNKNIYTPRYIRADNGFFVDGSSIGITGTGNLIGIGTVACGAITSTGNATFTGSGSDGTSNAFLIRRGSNNNGAFRVQNDGVVVIEANYFYAASSGVSLYVQNGAVFRGNISNDSSGQPVTINDNLRINGTINLSGKDVITSSGTTLTIGDITDNDEFDSVKIKAMSGTSQIDVGDSEMTLTGDVYITENLRHSGDANTRIQFTGDRIRMYSGNVEMLDLVEGGTDYVDIIDRVRVTSGGDMICEGDVVAFTSTTVSDINQKENIKPIKDAVSKVKRLAGVTFDWKKDKEKSAGVIAQDVEKVLPEIVKQKEDREGEEFKSVDYNGIIGLLVEGMKEQQEEIEKLKKLLEDK